MDVQFLRDVFKQARLFYKGKAMKGGIWSFALLTALAIGVGALVGPSPAMADDIATTIDTIRAGYASTHSGAPTVSNISAPSTVEAYKKYEISFDVGANFDNPFDPVEIAVDGLFTYPDSSEVVIPGFYNKEYTRNDGKVLLEYQLSKYTEDDTTWMIRFSSGITGNYSFKIRVIDINGTTTTSSTSFTVTAAQGSSPTHQGYVQISKDNPMYFEHSADNSLFYGSGSNIPWIRSSDTPDPDKRNYNYYLDQAKDETSSTRVWLCHWAWLEWVPDPTNTDTYSYAGVNFYNQPIASMFDEVLSRAEDNDLKIILTLDDNNEQQSGTTYDQWVWNPYNKSNYKGVVTDLSDYWTNSDVRIQYKKRLRYIIARWGYSTSLWTLNLWNDHVSANSDQVLYLGDLRNYVHSITDPWRPINFGSNFRQEANQKLDYVYSSTEKDQTKPNVSNEIYYTDDTNYFGSVLQEQIWTRLVNGEAAVMVWPHQLVDGTGSWSVFSKLLSFLSDVPLNKKHFDSYKPGVASVGSGSTTGLQRIITVAPYNDIPAWGRATENTFEINTSENGQFLSGYTNYLFADGYKSQSDNWHNPPTFIINVPSTGGSMMLKLDRIGPNAPKLRVTLNGQIQDLNGAASGTDIAYSGGARDVTTSEEYVEVPLTAGTTNSITVDNSGNQWIELKSVYFILNTSSASDVIDTTVLSSGDEALVYVDNQTYSQLYQTELQGTPVTFGDVGINVGHLLDGTYAVTYYNPSTGSVTETDTLNTSGGTLELNVDSLGKDAAVKIKATSILGLGLGHTLFNDNFNDGTLDAEPANWTLTYNNSPNSISVAADVGSFVEKYMKLVKTDTVTSPGVVAERSAVAKAGKVLYEAKVRPSSNNTKYQFGPLIVNSAGAEIINVIFKSNGDLSANNGASDVKLLDFNPNEWYDIQIVFDVAAGQYDIWVNGNLEGNDFAIETGQTSDSAAMRFKLIANAAISMDVDQTRAILYDNVPPAEVSGLSAVPGTDSITLNWTDPTDADLDTVKVFDAYNGFQWLKTVAKSVETAVISNLQPGTEYKFRVKAFDLAGNYTGGKDIIVTTQQTVSYNDTAFTYTGSWNTSSGQDKYMGDDHYSNTTGNYYEYSFTGTKVDLYAAKASHHGKAAISIDGGTEAIVDLYAATRSDNVLVWSSPTLTAGSHTVKVRVSGTKNASSTGYTISADRIDVTG